MSKPKPPPLREYGLPLTTSETRVLIQLSFFFPFLKHDRTLLITTQKPLSGEIIMLARNPLLRFGVQSRKTRRAFTLVELLVVIAIIGVLVGLLLPAVQAAREAARRMSCSSNVRQLAMAVTNFEGARKQMPENFGLWVNSAFDITAEPNYTTLPTNPYAQQIQASWLVGILPYMEQDPLYQQINLKYDVNFPQNDAAAKQRISLFRCPSDTTPTTLGSRSGRPGGGQYAVTSYKGVSGSNWAWGAPAYRTATDPRYAGDPFFINNGNGLGNGNGIFFAGLMKPLLADNKPGTKCNTLIAAVKDGLSNTVMIGESIGAYSTNNWWFWHTGSVATVAIPLNAAPICDVDASKPVRKRLENCATDWENNMGFTSDHGVGANFASADGSVRFLSNQIDNDVYRAIGGISDGLVVNIPE